MQTVTVSRPQAAQMYTYPWTLATSYTDMQSGCGYPLEIGKIKAGQDVNAYGTVGVFCPYSVYKL